MKSELEKISEVITTFNKKYVISIFDSNAKGIIAETEINLDTLLVAHRVQFDSSFILSTYIECYHTSPHNIPIDVYRVMVLENGAIINPKDRTDCLIEALLSTNQTEEHVLVALNHIMLGRMPFQFGENLERAVKTIKLKNTHHRIQELCDLVIEQCEKISHHERA